MRVLSSLFVAMMLWAVGACRATAPVTESNPNALSDLFDQPVFWIVGIPMVLLLGIAVVAGRRRGRKQHALQERRIALRKRRLTLQESFQSLTTKDIDEKSYSKLDALLSTSIESFLYADDTPNTEALDAEENNLDEVEKLLDRIKQHRSQLPLPRRVMVGASGWNADRPITSRNYPGTNLGDYGDLGVGYIGFDGYFVPWPAHIPVLGLHDRHNVMLDDDGNYQPMPYRPGEGFAD